LSNLSRSMTLRPKVYVTRPDVAKIGLDLLKEECEVTSWSEENTVPRSELLKNVQGKDALFCTLSDKIDKEVLDAAGSSLKVIGTISVGYDHIDIEECKSRKIKIGYTPEVLTDATAELTVALLLATSRRLLEASKEVYNGGWKAWAPGWMLGHGLKNSTVGIVGLGRIGLEVAKRIVTFKPKLILYTSRAEKAEAADVNGVRVSLDQLLRESDFVIVTTALTPETKELFNAEAFSKMKPSAIFINSSRGAVVDQEALYNALKSGQIYSAGLDVCTPEPIPLDSPLLTLPNLVILPHIGSADIETRTEMSRITAANILCGLRGEPLECELI